MHLQREIRLHAGARGRRRRRGTAASRRARPGSRAGRCRCVRSSSGSMRSRKCSSSTYSAGMVASASSSNTQWPSGCCRRSSAATGAGNGVVQRRCRGCRSACIGVRQLARMQVRRRCARTGWHPRWSRAGRSRSSPPPARGCASAVRAPGRRALLRRRSRRRWRASPSPRAHGGIGARRRQRRAHIRPDRARRSSSAGRSTSRLAALMVTETMPGLTNTHSAVPPITPMKPAAPGIGGDAEMHVEDGLERVRHHQPGQQVGGDRRRHRQHHRGTVDVAPGRRTRAARSTASSRRCQCGDAPPGVQLAAARGEPGQRRIDEAFPTVPTRGTSGTQAAPPRISVSATTAPEQAREARVRRRVQRGDRERFQQSAIQRAAVVAARPPRSRRRARAAARASDR